MNFIGGDIQGNIPSKKKGNKIMKHEIGMCDFDDSYDWQPSNKKNNEADVPRNVQAAPNMSKTQEPIPAAIKRNAISLAEWVIRNRDARTMSFGERTAWNQGRGFIEERDVLNKKVSDSSTIEIIAKPLEQFSIPATSPAATRTLVLSR